MIPKRRLKELKDNEELKHTFSYNSVTSFRNQLFSGGGFVDRAVSSGSSSCLTSIDSLLIDNSFRNSLFSSCK